MARWIPFDTASHLERDDSVDFRTVGGRFSVDDVPDQALALAPPSLSLAMLARKEARQRSADLEGVDALDFVRGKKVAIAGCSLDRNAMASMCKTLGLGESELTIDLHGYSSCHFRVRPAFHIGSVGRVPCAQLMRTEMTGPRFHRRDLVSRRREGALPRRRQGLHVRREDGERLPASGPSQRARTTLHHSRSVRSHCAPADPMPDASVQAYLIRSDRIAASGTWDQRSLSAIFQPTEDVSASKQHQAPKDKLVPLLPLQAYAYYQTRLRDMVRFLRAEFPDAGLMFRPETYQNKNTNALVYNIREAAIAAMRSVQVPIFLCGYGTRTVAGCGGSYLTEDRSRLVVQGRKSSSASRICVSCAPLVVPCTQDYQC